MKPKIDKLVAKYRIARLYVFGSVTNEQFNDESDIDLLVHFKDIPLLEYADNYFDLQEELEQIFGRKVDLLIDKSVKNPYLAKSIDKTKIPLYE